MELKVERRKSDAEGLRFHFCPKKDQIENYYTGRFRTGVNL